MPNESTPPTSTTPPAPHPEPAPEPRRQYSLKSLFWLTLAIGVLLGGVLALGNIPRFHALRSVMALTALIPIVVICLLDATRLVTGRNLVFVSLATYLLAMIVPALRLGGDMTFGFQAFGLSFFGLQLFRNMGHSGEQFWYPIACLMGAAVNVLLITSFLTALPQPRSRYAFVAASVATLLALAVIIPLGQSGELNKIYIGHGLWVASVLAVALGSRRTL